MIERGEQRRQVIEKIGGASRARTDDLIVANDALSQLSYSPTGRNGWLVASSFYQRSLIRTKPCTDLQNQLDEIPASTSNLKS